MAAKTLAFAEAPFSLGLMFGGDSGGENESDDGGEDESSEDSED